VSGALPSPSFDFYYFFLPISAFPRRSGTHFSFLQWEVFLTSAVGAVPSFPPFFASLLIIDSLSCPWEAPQPRIGLRPISSFSCPAVSLSSSYVLPSASGLVRGPFSKLFSCPLVPFLLSSATFVVLPRTTRFPPYEDVSSFADPVTI